MSSIFHLSVPQKDGSQDQSEVSFSCWLCLTAGFRNTGSKPHPWLSVLKGWKDCWDQIGAGFIFTERQTDSHFAQLFNNFIKLLSRCHSIQTQQLYVLPKPFICELNGQWDKCCVALSSLDKCQRSFIQTFIDVVKQNDQCPHALHILIYKGSLINVLKAFLTTAWSWLVQILMMGFCLIFRSILHLHLFAFYSFTCESFYCGNILNNVTEPRQAPRCVKSWEVMRERRWRRHWGDLCILRQFEDDQ